MMLPLNDFARNQQSSPVSHKTRSSDSAKNLQQVNPSANINPTNITTQPQRFSQENIHHNSNYGLFEHKNPRRIKSFKGSQELKTSINRLSDTGLLQDL